MICSRCRDGTLTKQQKHRHRVPATRESIHWPFSSWNDNHGHGKNFIFVVANQPPIVRSPCMEGSKEGLRYGCCCGWINNNCCKKRRRVYHSFFFVSLSFFRHPVALFPRQHVCVCVCVCVCDVNRETFDTTTCWLFVDLYAFYIPARCLPVCFST